MKEPTRAFASSMLDMPSLFETVTLDCARHTWRSWLAATRRIQDESLHFALDHAHNAFATMGALAHCGSPTDFLGIQAHYVASTIGNLAIEGRKLAEIVGALLGAAPEQTKTPRASGKRGALAPSR